MSDTLAAIDVGTNSFHLVVARVTGQDRFDVDREREGDGAPRPRRRRHEGAERRGHGPRRRHAGPLPPASPTSTGRPCGPWPPAPPARPRTTRSSSSGPASRGRRRARGHLRRSRRPGSSTSACCRPSRCSTSRCSCATSAAAAPSCCSATAARCSPRAASSSAPSASPTASSRRADQGGRHRGLPLLHPLARHVVFRKEVEAHGFEVAIGSSGTIEAVAQMVHAATGEPPLRTYNRFTLHRVTSSARSSTQLASARTVRQRASIAGPGPSTGRHHPRRRAHPRGRRRRGSRSRR